MSPSANIQRFELATAGQVIFGWGALAEAGRLARAHGERALVITGAHPERAAPLLSCLEQAGVQSAVHPVGHEPDLMTITAGVERARAGDCAVVVGFGGGSVLDAAKAISALLTNEGALLDYLEVVGGAQPLARPAAPCLAIPTTAGTGAEVTRNSVLTSTDHRVKVSLRSPHLLPRVALVDPALTLDLPPGLTATTGMDALTQLIEPHTCNRANPLVDALCLEGIARVARSLERAVADGRDTGAREDMALASLFGGLALANAGLGAVHGLAGPLGGRFQAPHGALCAILLPPVMGMNVRALRERQPGSPILERYTEVARRLTGNPSAPAETGVTWVADLVARLGIPRLGKHGVEPAHLPGIVEQALRSSSMKANPLPLTPAELTAVLEQAL